MSTVVIDIPGKPYALKRHRSTRTGIHYDPKENISWKAYAADFMKKAMGDREPFSGPLEIEITVCFAMPQSRWLKQGKRQGGPHYKRPDLDNIEKAVKDAANGIIWHDDAQVFRCYKTKWIRDQGKPAYVKLMVMPVEDVFAYVAP